MRVKAERKLWNQRAADEIPCLMPCFLIPNVLNMLQTKEKDHLAPCHLHISEGLRIKPIHRKEVLVNGECK